jgi:nitrite reductase (NADH) small subunit
MNLVKVKVAELSELKEQIGKEVMVQGYQVGLFLLTSGKVLAIENRCPHKGGTLTEGIVSEDHVFCPLHDWKICLEDGLVQAPDTGCVKTFDVTVEGQNVYLTIE